MSEDEAYMLLTMCGKVRAGQHGGPEVHLGASIAKRYVK
jgi:amidase